MTLEEAKQVLDSLKECNPNVEDFSWGPTLEFARRRKDAAMKILRAEIKLLKQHKEE
jgi:hypothetical protein